MPSQSKSARSSRTIASVESVVVWSSASTVTQTPARWRPLADRVRVLQRDLLAVARQRLAERRQLQRHLQRPHGFRRGLGRRPERVEQLEISVDRGVRRVDVGDVLAEIVDADTSGPNPAALNGSHRVGDGLAGHEPVHHLIA